MRDKVKRFISILMTALMLVNLLPVGALADGVKISNSVQNRWPWEPKPTPKPAANVYVYVKATGDPELIANLTINSSGWFTIGMSANVPGMGNPSEYAIRSYSFGDVGVSHQTVLSTNFTRWKYNQEINTDDITWTEFYIDNGADDYVKAGTLTWHMNGKIDIRKVPSVYTIQYVDYDTKKVIRSYDEPGYMGQKPYKNITAPASWQDDEYSYSFLPVDGHPQTQTVTFEKQTDTLTFYYKKNTAAYTVNYYLNGTTTKVADSKNDTAPLGETVTKSPITVDGYTPVSNDKKSITIGTGTNEINFYYYKNVELTANSATVTYDGNVHSVSGFTGAPDGADFRAITVGAAGTNVGTYTAAFADGTVDTVDATGKYIVTKATDGQLVITPKAIKVTVTGNTDTKVYNGKLQSVVDFTTDAPEGVTVRLKTGKEAKAEGQNVGTYPMGLTKEDFEVESQNYAVELSVTDGWLEISKRSVTLTSAPDSKVYDGNALTNDTVTVSGDGFAKDEGAAYDVTGTQTDVGTSDNTFTYTLNKGTKADNYSIELVFGKLEVTPVTDEVIVTITGRTDEMPYDGKEHSVFGYDVTVSNALYNTKEDMQFNGIDADATAKGTDAGTYPIGLTAANFTNKSKNFSKVTFVVTDGYVKITPRAVTLTSETAGKTYDGTALEKPVVTVGGDGFVEGQVKEIKATGSVTNAGSVANTITFTPVEEKFNEKNYNIQKTEGTLTIVKRSVLITSQSATKTYDGSALTRPAVTITGDGFVPGELAKAEATGSITKVGSTPNAIQYTTTGAFNAANYTIALSVGTLTVTEKPKPEPRRTFNLTISYVYQNGKRAAASYNRGGLKNGETFDITSPVIAGYTASETVVSGTIYNRDIKVTVIYTADGVNLDDYGVPLGLGNITMNVGDCFE